MQPSPSARPGRPSRSRVSRDYLADPLSALTAKAARPPERSVPREHPQLAAARKQVAKEARFLREAGPLTDDERGGRLAELAHRLTALMRQLSARGVPRSEYSTLLALHGQLKKVRDPGDAFWDYVLQVLDDFAGDAGLQKRRAFWKQS